MNVFDLNKIKDQEKIRFELEKLSQKIEEAIHKSIEEAPFPRKQIAVRWGVSESLISKILNPYDPAGLHTHKIPQFVYATLQKHVIIALAEVIGCFLVENPKPVLSGNTFLDFSQTLQEFSRLAKEVGKAFEDGIVTSDEAKRIRAAWEALKRKGEGFLIEIESIATEG